MAFTKEEIKIMAFVACNKYNAKYQRPKKLYYKILSKYYFIKTRIEDVYLVLIGKKHAITHDELDYLHDYDDWDD